MRKFVLTCIEAENETVKLEVRNEGFNGMELLAILEMKKADLVEQFTHPEKFRYERELVDSDGNVTKKIKEGE